MLATIWPEALDGVTGSWVVRPHSRETKKLPTPQVPPPPPPAPKKRTMRYVGWGLTHLRVR